MFSVSLWQFQMWEEIGLIGRDKLLESKLLPRLHHPTQRFVLVGDAGVGKSAILEWCAAQVSGRRAVISASKPHTQNVKSIVEQWELDAEGAKAQDYEDAILSCEGHTLFVDDLNMAGDKTLFSYQRYAEYHKVCGAMRPPKQMKDNLRQFLWAAEQIQIQRLKRADAERLAQKMCLALHSKVSYHEVAKASRGLPGRMAAYCTTGEIPRDEARLASEELDISMVLLIVLVLPVLLRVIGRATDATDLTAIGGVAMLLLLGGRMFLQKGQEKK